MNGVSAEVWSCLVREFYLSCTFCSKKSRKCNWIYCVKHLHVSSHMAVKARTAATAAPNTNFLLLPVDI